MKTKILPLLSFLSFTLYFSSCTSSKQDTVFYDTSKLNNCSLTAGKINVTINQVHDKEIEDQLRQIVEVKNNMFCENIPPDKTASFNVSIIERKIIEDLEPKYSSFIYTSITDSNDSILFENCCYKKSRFSIVSSDYLNKCISEVYSKLNKTVTD